MGICGCENNRNRGQSNNRAGNNQAIKVEGLLKSHAKPTTLDEIQDLYSYKTAVCKIFFEASKEGKKVKGSGTGFFCDLDDFQKNFIYKSSYTR